MGHEMTRLEATENVEGWDTRAEEKGQGRLHTAIPKVASK